MALQVMRSHSDRGNRLVREVGQTSAVVLQCVDVEEGVAHAQVRLGRRLLRRGDQLGILTADFLRIQLVQDAVGGEVLLRETHLLD